jgi:hypothetical protein
MEVVVTEVAVTWAMAVLVGATSAEAAPICTLAEPTYTLEGPMFASPETVAAVGPAGMAGMGITADPGMGLAMADFMPPATRMGGLIRIATGRNEPKPIGVLNDHFASHESLRHFISAPICVTLHARGGTVFASTFIGPIIRS